MPSPNFSPEFDNRFRNWLRWCTENPAEPNSPCCSIEGRYKSPQIWDEVRPNMGLLNPVNKWDAMVLQRGYVGLLDYDRRVIKFMYFRPHWRREWVAQKLNVRKDMLGEALYESKYRMYLKVGGDERRVA